MYDSFHPGEEWLDTNGNKIQAHGGSIIVVDGVYYWYGENKEKTTGKDKIWHWGVRCYASTDLYNWEDKGIIVPPEVDDEKSTLHPHSYMDRPHIIYNERTKKYVMWLKIMQAKGVQSMTVLVADNILGPYKKIRENYKPLDMNSGDFDLVKASDGKAYWYFERVHSELICADLDYEYTAATGYYTSHFPQPCPPYVREAPAFFERNFKKYLVTSGTTGYLPNPSEFAVADSYHGPFKVLGNAHVGDESNTSFHSQISSVFKVPGKKDLYIALADIWVSSGMHMNYTEIKELFDMMFLRGEHDKVEEFKKKHNFPKTGNTCEARYLWLPITFNGDIPEIRWRDEWKLSDFE